jgi:hypothetical protein
MASESIFAMRLIVFDHILTAMSVGQLLETFWNASRHMRNYQKGAPCKRSDLAIGAKCLLGNTSSAQDLGGHV